MSNAIISYPDRSLAATLSGGSWSADNPLANLLDHLLSHQAISTNDDAASSIVQANLGAAYAIRTLSLINHNLSKDATIRVRGYSDSGYTSMVSGADTGTVTAWPAGFTAQQVSDNHNTWTFCFTTSKTAQYWKWEIIDTTNPDGVIKIGRTWHGEATFEPAIGISDGASIGYEFQDLIDKTPYGVQWSEKRPAQRTFVAVYEMLSAAEKRQGLLMQKILTGADEALWITFSAASADDMLFEAFPCFLRKASAITYPYCNNHEMPIEVIEKL